jgi:hypothetical protein
MFGGACGGQPQRLDQRPGRNRLRPTQLDEFPPGRVRQRAEQFVNLPIPGGAGRPGDCGWRTVSPGVRRPTVIAVRAQHRASAAWTAREATPGSRTHRCALKKANPGNCPHWPWANARMIAVGCQIA